MEKYAVLPIALQLCLDDIAWHKGDDSRTSGRPSRTGIPRMHAPEDYYAVNEVGRALDMKIIGPLCLGEWDRDNLLRGEVGITYDPYGWDRKSEIDYPMAEKYFEAAESSEYIEYAVHGLLHGQYDECGRQINEQEYFIMGERDGVRTLVPIPIDDLCRRLDLFYKIYDSWGFKKKIRTIVSPGGVSSAASFNELLPFAEEFRSRGLVYWPNGWYQIDGAHHFLSGVMCMRETGGGMVPWNAYDYDPAMLADIAPTAIETGRSVFGMHWPNFFRYNPKKYMDHVPAWVDYFERQAEYFGCMLSRDIAFAANQEIHVINARVECTPEKCRIDLGEISNIEFKNIERVFYVSIKSELTPRKCIGGVFSLYEKHGEFNNYKIEYKADTVELIF